jgi:hypothetical protein
LQFAQANAQTKNCKRACTSPTEKNFKIFFPTLQKKIKHPTHKPKKSTRQMTATDDIKKVVTHDRQERQPITAPTKNWRLSASYDCFVVNQTFVLRMKFSGKNRHLRQAANRYVAFINKSNF